MARLKIFDRHHDLERGIRLDRVQILRRDKLRGRHVCRRRDHTHWGRIARTVLDLRTVCKGQFNGQAEVDEVVRGRQGWRLACGRVGRPILFKPGANNPLIQR